MILIIDSLKIRLHIYLLFGVLCLGVAWWPFSKVSKKLKLVGVVVAA
jgi:hypothetical protein